MLLTGLARQCILVAAVSSFLGYLKFCNNVMVLSNSSIPESSIQVLTTLHKLRHLDISRQSEQSFDSLLHGSQDLLDVRQLLSSSADCFQELCSLDISGWRDLKSHQIR